MTKLKDDELSLYRKALRLARAGNERLAEAIKRHEGLNLRLHAIEAERTRIIDEYDKLEKAIIEEARGAS